MKTINALFTYYCINHLFTGLHLEGPFISVAKKGAHNEEYIRSFPNGYQDVIDFYGDLDNVAMVTLAPELERSSEVIQELCNRGIRVSMGMILSC